MGIDINVFSPGFRHPIFLSIPVIDVYTREKPTHTSGLDVVNASWAGTLRWSDSSAVCGNGAWASAICVAARVLTSDFPQYILVLGCPLPWEVVHGDPRRLPPGGRRLWLAACLGERCGAAGIRFQASAVQLPLPLLRDQSLVA